MKNKAFTLLELLGVVIILGVLSLIAFPPLLNQIKKAKQGIKDSTKTLIIDAAKDYYEDNTNNFDLIEGMTYCIDIKTLTDENYLNKNLKNENLNNIDTSKKVKLIYHNEKFNYDVVDSCTYYTVTFDANGGNIDTESKEVLENSTYGDLPTPTRSGYTFMGWNGINLYNPDEMIISNTIHSKGTEEIEFKAGLYDRILLKSQWTPKPSTEYTLIQLILENTFDKRTSLLTDERFYISKYNDRSSIEAGEKNTWVTTFTTRDDFTNVTQGSVWVYTSNTVTGIFKIKMAIYEGTELNEYEPYYITPDTKVVQKKDHTLKAIWKENE